MATRITIDAYVIDALMPDLVGHDRQPSAFLVYLYLYRHAGSTRGRLFRASLQQIASDTGLSKSAVQQALRTLKRRRLVHARSVSATTAPDYEVKMPWVRTAAER
jgi:DNA-binding transcriptional ArsR family regulator